MAMIHGPFNKFEAMMHDAFKRASYVESAFHHVLAEQCYKLLDEDQDIADWGVINGLAKECGMVISVHPDDYDGHAWTYELTEDDNA
jgi:predicted DsbA family dithiol-disulfide isomerase